MEALNPTRKMQKERKSALFESPPYCQKEFPCIPLIDECMPVPLKLEVSDATRIMYFMENFNGISTKELEFDINTYLKAVCQATDVFIIHLLRVSGKARVQMLTDRVLESDVVISMNARTMDKMVERDGPNFVCAENLHPDIQQLCKDVLGKEGDSVHLIPILSRCRRHKDESLKIQGNPVAMICLTNCEKIDYFVLRATQELFRYCTTTLLNTMEGEEERKLKQNYQLLLEGAKSLFTNIHDLDKLLKEIMRNSRIMTNAEKFRLFLMDPEHLSWVSKAFTPDSAAVDIELRIGIDQGIPAHVAANGRTLNIPNVYEHPLFHKDDDKNATTKTRDMLCFPIRDEKGFIIGVGQACNKKKGSFDIFDEEIVEEFSSKCGIAFMHAVMYKKMEECVRRNKKIQDVINYNINITLNDVTQVLCCKTVHAIPHCDSFEFLTRGIISPETVCYILKMFEDLDFINKFQIKDTVLVKFFLTIKEGHRERPYRNWQHSFATGHFIYCMLKQLNLISNRYIAPIEGLALLIAGFCHNIDHFGSTNPYLLNTDSILANFFTSEHCTQTRHSLNQTLNILSMEGCSILEGLNDKDFNVCIDVIKDLIHATDIGLHLKLIPKQKQICTEYYQNFNPEHRYYLTTLIMSAAVLSDFVKDFSNTKRIAWYLFEEFFSFGDMEKQFDRKPVKGMDRTDVKIPEMIVSFLEVICRPLYHLFATIFPKVEVMTENLDDNIIVWKKLSQYFVEVLEEGEMAPLDILLSEGLEGEIQRMKELLSLEKVASKTSIESETDSFNDHDEDSDTSM